jgi:hypothetical protein
MIVDETTDSNGVTIFDDDDNNINNDHDDILRYRRLYFIYNSFLSCEKTSLNCTQIVLTILSVDNNLSLLIVLCCFRC